MKNAVAVQEGVRLEIFTVAYMVLEASLSIGAAIQARSVLLAAFGIDSLIELVSGAVLLWRLHVEAGGGNLEQVERAEQRASRLTAIVLLLLCIYVLISSIYGLLVHTQAESSLVGIGVSLAAVVIMPFLAFRKKRVAKTLRSAALAEDATASITCAYMAGTVLIGLLLNALFHWWWVEDVAALAFLFWLGRETWEAFEEAGLTNGHNEADDQEYD
jgi:divalent metal cation (Fe/Co/Zn/Cd) transporter